jgi:hypothetical protein
MFDTHNWSALTKTVVLIAGIVVIFFVTFGGQRFRFLRERTPSIRQIIWVSSFGAFIMGLATVALIVFAVREAVSGDVSLALAQIAVAALTLGRAVVGFVLVRRFADPRRKLSAQVIASHPQEQASGRADRMFAYDARVTLDNGEVVDGVRIVAGRLMRVRGRPMLPFSADHVVDVHITKVRTA